MEVPMNLRKKAIAELKEANADSDTESAHGWADQVLCELLVALGYQDVVDEYDKIDKWYA
jgi:hypothetical protein